MESGCRSDGAPDWLFWGLHLPFVHFLESSPFYLACLSHLTSCWSSWGLAVSVRAHFALNSLCTWTVLPPLSSFLHPPSFITYLWCLEPGGLSKHLRHEIKWRGCCEAHRAGRRLPVKQDLYPPRPLLQQWCQRIAPWSTWPAKVSSCL